MTHSRPIIFVGEETQIFRAKVLASALRLWVKHRIKANRLYNPKRMMATAAGITKKSFRPQDYEGAAAELDRLVADFAERKRNAQLIADQFGGPL